MLAAVPALYANFVAILSRRESIHVHYKNNRSRYQEYSLGQLLQVVAATLLQPLPPTLLGLSI